MRNKSFIELFNEYKERHSLRGTWVDRSYVESRKCTRCGKEGVFCQYCCFKDNFQIVYRCKGCINLSHLYILDEKEIFLLKIHGIL